MTDRLPTPPALCLAWLSLAACGPDEVSASSEASTTEDDSSPGSGSSSETVDGTGSETGTETRTETETGDPDPDPPLSSCSLVWSATLSSDDGLDGQAWAFAVDADENLYVAGGRGYVPFPIGVGWLAKYDSAGALLWSRSYPELNRVHALELGDDGSVYAVGVAFLDGIDPGWVGRISASDGALLWSHPLAAEVHAAAGLALDLDGNVLVTGAVVSDELGTNTYDLWLARFAREDGSELWSTAWDPHPTMYDWADRGVAVAVGPDATIYVGGRDGVGDDQTQAVLFGFTGDDAPAWVHAPFAPDPSTHLMYKAVEVGPRGELVVWTGSFGGHSSIAALDPETREVLWSRSGAALEHHVVGLALDRGGNVVAAQAVDTHEAAVRMWTSDGTLLCRERHGFTAGAEQIIEWYGGGGPSSSAGLGGIWVTTDTATLHYGRFALD